MIPCLNDTPPQMRPLERTTSTTSVFEPARKWRPRAFLRAELAAPNGATLRRADLQVSFGFLAAPQAPWVARFWEEKAPPGAKPVEWFLGSRATVTCLEDALDLLACTDGLLTAYTVTIV